MEALQANKLTPEALPGQVCPGASISRKLTLQSTILSCILHVVTQKPFLSARQRPAEPVAPLDAKQSLLLLGEVSVSQSQTVTKDTVLTCIGV